MTLRSLGVMVVVTGLLSAPMANAGLISSNPSLNPFGADGGRVAGRFDPVGPDRSFRVVLDITVSTYDSASNVLTMWFDLDRVGRRGDADSVLAGLSSPFTVHRMRPDGRRRANALAFNDLFSIDVALRDFEWRAAGWNRSDVRGVNTFAFMQNVAAVPGPPTLWLVPFFVFPFLLSYLRQRRQKAMATA